MFHFSMVHRLDRKVCCLEMSGMGVMSVVNQKFVMVITLHNMKVGVPEGDWSGW